MRTRRNASAHAGPAGDVTGHDRALISVRGLVKAYVTLDATITAADGIDLDITAGTVTALTGPSGSGKSTLLHLIGALDTPDAGTITVSGTEITALGGNALADYRRTTGEPWGSSSNASTCCPP